MRRWSSVAALLLATTLGASSSARAASFRESDAARDIKKRGARIVREIAVDLDGDGADEIGVVEGLDGRMRLLTGPQKTEPFLEPTPIGS